MFMCDLPKTIEEVSVRLYPGMSICRMTVGNGLKDYIDMYTQ